MRVLPAQTQAGSWAAGQMKTVSDDVQNEPSWERGEPDSAAQEEGLTMWGVRDGRREDEGEIALGNLCKH